MNKYTKGKIYKITSKNTDKFYIGSTTESLKKRLGRHKNIRNCSSKEIIEADNYEINLLENYPCNSKKELLIRETYYYDLYKKETPNLLVNKICPYTGLSRKEYCKNWNIKNNEDQKKKKKDNYQKKKVEISIKRKNDMKKPGAKEKKALIDKKYKDNLSLEGKEKMNEVKRKYHHWRKSMGGDIRFNNNLLEIDKKGGLFD